MSKVLGPQCSQKGLSLVELMVALVLGMFMSLAIFAAMATFEGQKRTTTSVNDINQAGNYAIYVIDKWVRSAGSGYAQAKVWSKDSNLVNAPSFGCQLYASSGGTQLLPRTTALPAPFALVNTGAANIFRLAPILIAPGQTTPNISGVPSDVLIVMSGASGLGEAPIEYADAPISPSVSPINTVGFFSNDLALLIDKQPRDLVGGYSPCMIQQVKTPFSGGPASPTIDLAGAYFAPTVAGKTLNGMSPDGSIANLGNAAAGNPPNFLILGVGDNNTLFSYDLLQTSDNPLLPIADSVFELHALYGVDDNTSSGHEGIDKWVSASDSTSGYALSDLMAGNDKAAWAIANIKAIKIGLILRTSLPEKTDVAYVAPASLTLFQDTAVPYVRNLSAAERGFRYRVVETTVPLRNMLAITK